MWRKQMRRKVLWSAALCAVIVMPAAYLSAQYCRTQQEIGNMEVRLNESFTGCDIEAGPTWEYMGTKENRGRSITFMANGQVMIFVSTKDSEWTTKATGARCFQVLPFRTPVQPRYRDLGDGTVEVTSPSSHRSVFSTETGDPVSIEGVRFTLQPLQHMSQTEKNAGFVTLKAEKGYILFDFGWRTGGSPTSQLWRSVTVCDGDGNTCQVKMGDIFSVPDPIDANTVPKLTSNDELRAFLKKRCPKIVFPQ
jgi:hypothetical protein